MSADTLPALHRLQAERLGPRVAVRFKRDGLYHDLGWSTMHERATAGALALLQHGIKPGDRVGILAENRNEWLSADMAILGAGAVNVPLHTSLSAQQIRFQLDDAGVCWLFVANQTLFEKVESVRRELPGLRGIVLFDDESTLPPGVLSWRGFLQQGRNAGAGLRDELARREQRLQPDDLATIIYTSGTTGNPKGVMLSQRNLLSNAQAFSELSAFPPDAVFLNWLPFSHIYARTIDIYVTLVTGVTLCLAESADTVAANLAEIQPTNMSGVPRFYEKVLAAVRADDPAVMGKRLRAIFGARIDWLGSGGAPLPLAVAQAFRDAGLLLLQGYGLSESSPVISFNRKEAFRLESVGRPIPGIEVRIAGDGEVLTRGPHVMLGYWNNPQATAETIVDGWLHTGDLGRLDDDGFLHITGRKKDLLVLSNGKKVVPAVLEGLLLADPCIDQAVVCGEGRNYLSALIVPNWPNLCGTLALEASATALEWARDPKVGPFLLARIQQALVHQADYEQVQKIVVLTEAFNAARDEMTISLKLRRRVIVEHHLDELEALYRE
jgi:long-chain acyl-CoA synthetase